MSLTYTKLLCFAAILAGTEASAPRLLRSQKCRIFRQECRPGAFILDMEKNWTHLADTELINNRLRLVIPYVIIPSFSDKPVEWWRRKSPGGTKPANAQEWIDRIRPAIQKAAEYYEPTNVFFREYYQSDIDSDRFKGKQYVIISDFYDPSSSGCTADLGPRPSAGSIEVDAERCRTDSGNGNEYHPGVIAHEFISPKKPFAKRLLYKCFF